MSDGADYSAHVREFRHLLLSKQDTNNKHEGARVYLKRIFKEIDGNDDGTVADSELFDFMVSLEVPEQVAEILVQQIDINHDGKVTYSELAEFLWPRVESQREIGLVIEVVREALIASTGKKIIDRALRNNSEKDDVALLQAFADKTNAVLVRGRLIDVRQLKRALHNLMSTSLGELSDYEIDMLAHSMDANNDSVISAREFKNWLFLQKGYFRADSKTSDSTATTAALGNDSFTYDDVYPDPVEETPSAQAEAEAHRRRQAEIDRAAAERKSAEEDRIAAEIKRAEYERILLEKKKAELDRAATQRKREEEAAAVEAKRVAEFKKATDERIAAEAKARAEQLAAEKRATDERLSLEKKIEEAHFTAEKQTEQRTRTAEMHAAQRARAADIEAVEASEKESTPLLRVVERRALDEATISPFSLRAPCVMFAGTLLCVVVTYSVGHAIYRELR